MNDRYYEFTGERLSKMRERADHNCISDSYNQRVLLVMAAGLPLAQFQCSELTKFLQDRLVGDPSPFLSDLLTDRKNWGVFPKYGSGDEVTLSGRRFRPIPIEED